jgi:23S rRNA (guanosine2251-2'-O)-methyltransferase
VAHVRVVNVARAVELLRDMGYAALGLSSEAELDLRGALAGARPIALVLGAEGKGVRTAVLAACERAVRIPIDPRTESLNVSNAAAIALYECSQRRPDKTNSAAD